MIRLIVRRFLIAIPLILFVTFAVFVLIDRAPGDPAVTLAGEDPDPTRVAYLRKQLNLDDSVPVRWAKWFGKVLHGDLGNSLQTQQTVSDLVRSRFAVTLSLLVVSFVIAFAISFTLGILASLRPRGLIDRIVTVICSIGVAAPTFWIAILLVANFAVKRHLFPAVGYSPLGDGVWHWLRRLILPGLSLSLVLFAELTLQLKTAMTEVLGRDYILAAQAKGLSRSKVMFKHALKNAGVVVSTVAGLQLAVVVGGTATIETVFGLRGIGDLAVGATLNRDVSVMLGVLLVACVLVQIINLFVDIAYGYLNPKVRT